MNVRTFDIVVPTIGRPSLDTLLDALARSEGPRPGRVFVVDDRRNPGEPLPIASSHWSSLPLVVLRGHGAGPASARNVGWRASRADAVAFLDDDVVPDRDWLARLADDLGALGPDDAGSQGRIRVPRPEGRAPTDRERHVIGLEKVPWATADMAYRRRALARVGGFDERFPRAYREDADLALRVMNAGFALTRGVRTVTHPVRPADRWSSARLQAGNVDDALMWALHGAAWAEHAGAPRGRRSLHLGTVALALIALGATAVGRRTFGAVAASAWLAATGGFAWARIAPGPRSCDEVRAIIATSVAIPFAATYWWLRGLLTVRRRLSLEERYRLQARLDRSLRGTVRALVADRVGVLRVRRRPSGAARNSYARSSAARPGARAKSRLSAPWRSWRHASQAPHDMNPAAVR